MSVRVDQLSSVLCCTIYLYVMFVSALFLSRISDRIFKTEVVIYSQDLLKKIEFRSFI